MSNRLEEVEAVRVARLLILVFLIAVAPVLSNPIMGCGVASAGHVRCCKYCTKGKACGNTCISRRYTCHVGHGCACNANEAPTPAALIPGTPY